MLRPGILVVLSLLAVVLFSSPVYSGKKSYTMVCQGGGSMTAEFNRKVRWEKSDLFTTRIDFSKSGKAAGEQRPAAGQCAWLDRPISTDEPSVLIFEQTKKNPINNLKVGMRTMQLTSAAKEEMELIQAVYDGRQFIIQVRRDGDVLKITRTGP